MSKNELDLVRIGAVLNKHQVDYVIVGGIAVILQGGDTTTLDLDLALDRSYDNVERLANALIELSAKPKRWLTQNYRLRLADLGSKWLHLESDSGDIDLRAEVPGHSFELIKQNSERCEIDSTSLPVVSIAELIEMKSNTGRAKDSIHITELEELMRLQDDSE